MKKLLCKYCGNAEFYVLNVNETLCKCGVRLTKPSDYLREDSPKWRGDQKRQAEVVSKISLLNREIDNCLDERDEERFKKLTYELRLCKHALIDSRARFKERLNQNGKTYS
ncbi:IDEAL domain-containing protein [Neobacillus sp. MM2021_6]|uniref:IDEAL domain-containing protein n=1 Tax=Bacillaceae TaxID=186817 RepID=UPI00140BF770|nr:MULTISPECIES: IDEAL domain-containing protein [Bacillaceae]MBO0960976.1 IDEAL domain-containing protein [Neobacillus sp. MM2021_6]NHC19112.1 IDEAL domain-containing protein [Bacillus sp. MM2020_4]